MLEFIIPADPTHLERRAADQLSVDTDIGVEDTTEDEVNECCEELLDILLSVNEDALCVGDQEVFTKLYKVTKFFCQLQSQSKERLLETIFINTTVVASSASSLLNAREIEPDSLQAHRCCLQIYIFFLAWVSQQAEQEATAAAAQNNSEVPAGGAKKKAGAKSRRMSGVLMSGSWDWEGHRDKVLKSAAEAMRVDLVKLMGSMDRAHSLVNICTKLALGAMEQPAMMRKDRKEANRICCFEILGLAATRHQGGCFLARSLLSITRQHDHVGQDVAEACQFAMKRYASNQMVLDIITSFTAADPQQYDDDHKSNAAAVRRLATLVSQLAALLPRTVCSQISLLEPFFGCHAYPIRSELVESVGLILVGAFGGVASPDSAEGDMRPQSDAARLKTKEHLQKVLMERFLDKSSYTRQRVCKMWEMLVERNALRIDLWPVLLQAAVERLEDSSVMVQRSALSLMTTMLMTHPFRITNDRYPPLDIEVFTSTVTSLNATLKEVMTERGEAEDAEAAWEQGAVPLDGSEATAILLPTTQLDGSAADSQMPSQQPAGRSAAQSDPEKLRALIASMKEAVTFTRSVAAALPAVRGLMRSSSHEVVAEAIGLLVLCYKLRVQDAEAQLRSMWELIFAREEPVRNSVVDAFDVLYLGDAPDKDPVAVAGQLVQLLQGANVGELAALEEVVQRLVSSGRLRDKVVLGVLQKLWKAHQYQGDAAERAKLRCAANLVSMLAKCKPALIADKMQLLLDVSFLSSAPDAQVIGHVCVAIMHAAPELEGDGGSQQQQQMQEGLPKLLAKTMVSLSLPEDDWYGAAEAAVSALYALPGQALQTMAAVLRALAMQAMKPAPGQDDTSAAPGSHPRLLAHLLFLLGHTALQQLVLVDKLARQAKAQHSTGSRGAAATQGATQLSQAATQATQAAPAGAANDDIAAQVGLGAAAADAAVDELRERIEQEVMSTDYLIGTYGQLVSRLCLKYKLLQQHPMLFSSAVLALTKLMVVNVRFCEANIALVMTLLGSADVDRNIRCNLMVAMSDVAVRFPNVLEPWTPHMYKPLEDPDEGVRSTCLKVLTHLILNDMMKVKGHVASIARCMVDSRPAVAHDARLFFEELARKAHRSTNPVYNLLPDILSALSADRALPREEFRHIMAFLFKKVDKDKHLDALKEKFVVRFESVESPSELRDVAFCLASLSYTEKGLKKVMEGIRHYRAALGDPEVLRAFVDMAEKGRKTTKSSEVKQQVEDYLLALEELHQSLRDEEPKPTEPELQEQPDGMTTAPREAEQEPSSAAPSPQEQADDMATAPGGEEEGEEGDEEEEQGAEQAGAGGVVVELQAQLDGLTLAGRHDGDEEGHDGEGAEEMDGDDEGIEADSDNEGRAGDSGDGASAADGDNEEGAGDSDDEGEEDDGDGSGGEGSALRPATSAQELSRRRRPSMTCSTSSEDEDS